MPPTSACARVARDKARAKAESGHEERVEAMSHTPGPWTILYDGTGQPDSVKRFRDTGEVYQEPMRVVGSGGTVLATLRCFGGMPNRADLAKREADARLIAAAPELLRAAEWALILCERDGVRALLGEAFTTDDLDMIRRAVEQAGGTVP